MDLKDLPRQDQLDWAYDILEALKKECDLSSDHFIILAGYNYYRNLIRELPDHSLPLHRLRYKDRIDKLRKHLNG